MTLAQLAESSKVSIGLLSRLENGVGNPSFGALSAIARALGTEVSSFFEPPARGQGFVGRDDRVTLRKGRSGLELELLVASFSSPIVGVLITLPPGFEPGEPAAASPGQQFEVVLEGAVAYRVEDELHELEAGDFILFEASRPHSRANRDDLAPAEILSCATEARLDSYFPPSTTTAF